MISNQNIRLPIKIFSRTVPSWTTPLHTHQWGTLSAPSFRLSNDLKFKKKMFVKKYSLFLLKCHNLCIWQFYSLLVESYLPGPFRLSNATCFTARSPLRPWSKFTIDFAIWNIINEEISIALFFGSRKNPYNSFKFFSKTCFDPKNLKKPP